VHIAWKLKRRVSKGMSAAATEQARVDKVLRGTALDGVEPSLSSPDLFRFEA
jgi:hypothetical protein